MRSRWGGSALGSHVCTRAQVTRWLLPSLTIALAGIAHGQTPDVSVRLDVRLHYLSGATGPTTVRFYDVLARPSTVGLTFMLEPGFRAYISERFERIRNDGDTDQLDEYYVEDPGIWKVGKQTLPFGAAHILKMNVKAARGDTTLAFRDVQLAAALCDDGEGLTRGIVGRIGKRLGFSFAVGRNIGIQSSCLSLVRRPEDAPGKGRGYEQAFGADYSRKVGSVRFQAEYVALLRGETPDDRPTSVSDVSLVIEPSRYRSVALGWSREWQTSLDVFRIEGRFLATRNVWIEPLVRYRNGAFYDLGVSLRVKL